MAIKELKICPGCEKEVIPNDIYCPQCGATMPVGWRTEFLHWFRWVMIGVVAFVVILGGCFALAYFQR